MIKKPSPRCYIAREKRIAGWKKALELWKAMLQKKQNKENTHNE